MSAPPRGRRACDRRRQKRWDILAYALVVITFAIVTSALGYVVYEVRATSNQTQELVRARTRDQLAARVANRRADLRNCQVNQTNRQLLREDISRPKTKSGKRETARILVAIGFTEDQVKKVIDAGVKAANRRLARRPSVSCALFKRQLREAIRERDHLG